MTDGADRPARTFVALALPDAHRDALAAYLAVCADAAPGYRWVEAAGLHLTLRFLGGLDAAALGRLRAALPAVSDAPFTLTLGGVGTFGPRRAPRVVWLGLEGDVAACRALAASVEAACTAAGLGPDARPFRAHVTLGRQRADGARLPALPDPPPLGPWQVDEFVLFESRLNPPPATYVPLERYQLVSAPAR